jgi:phage-related protein
MKEEKQKIEYAKIKEKYPLLSLTIRNALISSLDSSNKDTIALSDLKKVNKAIGKFKKRKRFEINQLFLQISQETKDFTDVVPSIVRFFTEVKKLTKSKK